MEDEQKDPGMFAHYTHQNTSPSGLLSPANGRQMMNKHAAQARECFSQNLISWKNSA
jgi:hypothetical protein